MRLPDKDEHRRAWAAVEMDVRRKVMKSVNRGQALDSKPLARLAVGVARQQQKFWSRVWVIAPLFSLFFYREGWAAVAANAAVAIVFMGLMSTYWFLRARSSERANLEMLGIAPEEASRGWRRRGRGPAPEVVSDDADEEPGDGRAGTPHAANPPKRSRRKRR